MAARTRTGPSAGDARSCHICTRGSTLPGPGRGRETGSVQSMGFICGVSIFYQRCGCSCDFLNSLVTCLCFYWTTAPGPYSCHSGMPLKEEVERWTDGKQTKEKVHLQPPPSSIPPPTG
ncbi:hypothetical protein Q5P01_019075 [Channa striata]|uniref:Uncharacterized protein n=1 Tax=Channa striata TaxID=64152 RepID=A0AA88S563_CHASR|nr:hypothetical protein Q5P01_019075 [Channa striata]